MFPPFKQARPCRRGHKARSGLRRQPRTGRLMPMRQLLLLRHAKSSWDQRELPDHERPLNERGRRAAAAMCDAMDRLGLAPDLVLVSSSKRTMQTLDAFEPWTDQPLIERMEQLYNATSADLLATLREVKPTVRSVMVVAHNPGLHELALNLADAQELDTTMRRVRTSYPSGALTEFTIPGPWGSIGPGAARLVRFLCPRDIAGQD